MVYVNGEKRITDVRANDGSWHHVCVTWTSNNGTWAIYMDAEMRDGGSGLANGTSIEGKRENPVSPCQRKVKGQNVNQDLMVRA